MRWILLIALLSLVVGCANVTQESARGIACSRLASLPDGPTKKGQDLCSALVVTAHKDGMFLAELHDAPQKKLWSVIVNSSGGSEVSTMDENEQ
jgi:hypothetical protein